ncbi:hypothetical protein F2Q69_00044354 [Brassica cretica]|uniref:Uncharacterized protein n=1 Tax=Brassica cretica TaxID=69181 RepID=A0A8S9N9X7_BRACR|nr:hypothetical protein F2Q69_00044354 [Brassica cretica]
MGTGAIKRMRRTQVDIKERRKERCMRSKKQNGKGCRNVETRDHFHTAIITNLRMEFQETASRWEQTRCHSEEERGRSSRATRGPAHSTSQLPGDPDQKDKINEDLEWSKEEGRELGETDHTGMETDAVLELAEEFQNLTDGEGKYMGQVEATEAVEDDMISDNAERTVTAAAEKKTGLRKPLFSVAGGSNSKFVQVLMSPRKRAPSKQVRKGGGARPVEEKGPSHPKQLPKP